MPARFLLYKCTRGFPVDEANVSINIIQTKNNKQTMRKLLQLTKTLLVATMLGVGATSAWADGEKRVLSSNDYTGGTTDWNAPNGNAVYKDDGTSPRKYYAQTYGNTSRNASTYKSVSYSAGSGYTTAAMTVSGYNIEFDFLMRSGDVDDRSQSEFIASTTDVSKITANNYYSGSDYIFSISQPMRTNGNSSDYGSAISIDETWYVNNLSNSGTSITLTSTKWYHVKLVVTATSVDYTISEYTADGSSEMTTIENGTGSLSVASLPIIKGFWALVGRQKTTNGLLNFTNFEIYDYTDIEQVTDPAIAVAYAGANRTVTITGGTSSKSNTVTTYYTTDGNDPTSSSSVYSEPLNISADCTVKAITISSTTTASSIVSEAVTVGKLTLAAPTFKKTAYSEGSYTVTIADDQSGLQFVPASTTIKYRIGTTGDFSDYSSAVVVPVGKTLYAYSEAANYTTSSTASVAALSLPAMTLAFGQNYAGVVDADLAMTVAEGPAVSNAKSSGTANYFIPSKDGGTTAATNENISFYFNYNKDDTSQNKYWTLKTTGMYSAFGRGNANVMISNLTVGQIVEVSGSETFAASGMNKLDALCFGNTCYYQATATSATLTLGRQQTLYSINVYNLDNEIVGAMDYSTNYFTTWNTTPIVINAGETGYYKFVNHNNGGTAYQNWYLFAANDNKNYVVLRADNAQNNQTIDAKEYTGTISSFPTSSDIVADLCDATVELTVNLAKDGATYTLTSTAHITKADGTVMTPDYVFTQTDLPASSMNLFVSVEKNWLEILEQAVKKNITAAGYATYYSNNALDFANAKPAGLTASIITGATGATLNTTNVENVPAETPVLLAGAEGTYTIPVIATSSPVVSGNKLEGVHAATEKTANTIYVLMASPKVGFYSNNNAFTVGANTAYLPIDFASTGASAFFLFDDGSTTAIDAMKTQQAEDGVYYNLAGQRVAQPTKGLYIVNGKKVVVK